MIRLCGLPITGLWFMRKHRDIFCFKRGWRSISCFLTMVAVLTRWSCTTPAEHSNPLDPQSPDFTDKGGIAGQVTSYYQPFQSLSAARIYLLSNGGASMQSDADGRFMFSALAPASYTIVAEAPGHAADTATVEVFSRQTTTVNFRLDALPQVQDASVISAHVRTRASASDTDLVFLDIRAVVLDPDGPNDLTRVRVEVPTFAFNDTLTRGQPANSWQRIFAQDELKAANGAIIDPYNLVGAPFQIIATDAPGASVTSAPFQLARVIAEEPLPLAPANGETITTGAPQLRWQTPALAFDHTLALHVYKTVSGFQTLLLTIPGLPAGSNAAPYPGRLTSGSYFWTVTIVDRFGNSSRSKEATFQVQ